MPEYLFPSKSQYVDLGHWQEADPKVPSMHHSRSIPFLSTDYKQMRPTTTRMNHKAEHLSASAFRQTVSDKPNGNRSLAMDTSRILQLHLQATPDSGDLH